MNWPNDFDGAHHIQEDRQYIYESPDKGNTIYRREFGKLDRELISRPVQGSV